MTSKFDPVAFAQSTFTESNSTESIPVPAGEYPGLAEKVEIVGWAAKDGSKEGLKLKILWNIQDDSVREVTGRAENKVPQDIMLDLTDSGMLDMSKGMNVRLGKLREALGLNKAGQPFSFDQIQGQMAKLEIKHRTGADPSEIFAEVKAVAAL